MPDKIHILSDVLMKRIAAGEVIERPASIVKELLENAIDAGATEISIHIDNAGLNSILIIDNGEGMSESDAQLCCARHATSKLRTSEDLHAIHTLGFRGEALASISSVARMIITTRTEQDDVGTELHIQDGEIQNVNKTACNRGTSIQVKDLFYNVPARRKFLKSPATELKHIMTTIRRIGLAYSKIHFQVIVNGDKAANFNKVSPYERIQDVLTLDRTVDLVEFDKGNSDFQIHGYISRPGHGAKTRNEQFLYLNNRYIVNRTLSHAILSAYGTRLARDEYSVYVIYMTINPDQFDVNVHPTKIEVRFANERFLYNVLHRAIKDALNVPAVIPELRLVQGKREDSHPHVSHGSDNYGQMTLETPRAEYSAGASFYAQSVSESPQLWQIHNKYILSQIKSGLTIIDQHVAHERILFERALKSMHEREAESQALLFPQTVELSYEDHQTLSNILPYLEKIGFHVKEFGKNTVFIDAVPVEIKPGQEQELLLEIIQEYQSPEHEKTDIWHAVAASFACRAAIKAGEKLTQQEMASLIDQLFATDEPYFCPHGRPVVINVPLEEIDKRFGR